MWLVVHFVEENTVEVVPSNWYIKRKNECFWPDTKISKPKMLDIIKNSLDPLPNWTAYSAKILGEYSNFGVAEKKISKAKTNDVLSSSDLDVRKKKKPQRFSFSITSSENETDSDTSGEYPRVPSVLQKRPDDHQQEISEGRRLGHRTVTDTNQEIVTEGKLEEFKKEITRQFAIINAKLDDMSETLNLAIKIRQEEPLLKDIDDKLKNIISILPLSDQNNLNVLEKFLLDPVNAAAFSKYLSLVGGNSAKDVVKHIMFKIFSVQLGCYYSWDGAKKKNRFKSLKVAQVIIDTVRLNPPTKFATDCEIINNVKLWLVRCPDRIEGGRKSVRPGTGEDRPETVEDRPVIEEDRPGTGEDRFNTVAERES